MPAKPGRRYGFSDSRGPVEPTPADLERTADDFARARESVAPKEGPVPRIDDVDEYARTCLRASVTLDRAVQTAKRHIPPIPPMMVRAAWTRQQEVLRQEYEGAGESRRAVQAARLERNIQQMMAQRPIPWGDVARMEKLLASVTGTSVTNIHVESQVNVKFDVRVRTAIMEVTNELDAETFDRLAEGYEVPLAAE